MSARDGREEIIRSGVPVSSGIGIGRAYLVGRQAGKIPRHHVEADEVDAEIARLHRAIHASDRQLEKIKQQLAEESESETDFHIVTAHQLMLHDEHLVDATIRYVRDELINTEWALRKAVDDIRAVFEAIEDEYFRERASDVDHVADRVMAALLGRDEDEFDPPPDAIVVADDLSPADAARLHRAAVAGLVTDAGGKTSHTAIVARAHEIPAVVGLEDITEVIESDDLLIVDGSSGVVIVNPSASTVVEYRDAQRRQAARGAVLMSNRDLPSQTRDGVEVHLFANIDGPDEIAGALEHGARGVGLTRSEYLFMTSDRLPDEAAHFEMARSVIAQMTGMPATLRTFDLGADKLAGFLEEARLDEPNPALGLRSVRLCLHDLGLPLFRTQLRGLLRASALGPMRIMFPMISGVAELRAARGLLEEIKAELRAEQLPFDEHVAVGIMIEMPSSAITADLLARECDFFSIGTNDLIQYTMAVDRVNEYVSYLYEPLHPALLRLIHGVSRAARDAGIPAAVCGEMAGDPLVAPVLAGMGIHELSMSAVSIPEVKSVLRATTMSDLERLVAKVLTLATAAEVRQEVADYLDELGIQRGGSR
ncbi:MAG: phosphoenolpyruvate--protein phosphotransferase [Kofleriaceae bacterium]|nr:phosphoenolpyruvate--protein phosphotransferase [Myxococcales bacterium]MCB9558775.1 phosphoenolpyruvate--protein phosphotransferase [Kofleriaceae bacterium]MCB9570671.1 phosphoenolpyruvate--protein phosphotransferase [Kofleriaceae bacterium]